jgi:hypothetical protein
MKNSFLSIFVTVIFFKGYSQNTNQVETKYTNHNKGKIFIYWGGNRESYSKSDIHFKGADYDFKLYDVTAHDRPKGWTIDYINPTRLTIPQTSFRMGYFINNHYNISFGFDHMKYVMFQDKVVNSSGYYPNQGSYGDESLPNNQILLTKDFLTFEHTDGLNYINTEIARVDDISKFIGLPNTDKFQINLTEGFGAGILFPRTDASLLGKDRHDEFHVSGYGVSAKAGLNFTFYKHFFIQTELKGGYINMPDIRTTNSSSDRASQDFWFFQRIIVIGGIFKI